MSKLVETSGPKAFANKAKDVVLTAPTSPFPEKIFITEIQVGNSSGAAAKCSWGYRLLTDNWKAGQWDDSEAASYIEDTTDAQDAGTSDFAATTTTNNDGFIVQSKEVFNIVGMTVGTAGAGGSPAFEYTYWNGSSWSTLATVETPTLTSTGDTYLVFNQPVDWAALASADTPVATDGLTAGYYAIRIRATTAPSGTAASLSVMWVIRLLDYIESVPDGNSMVKTCPSGIIIPPGHSLIPYCSTADSGNWVDVQWRKHP